MPITTRAFAAPAARAPLEPFAFERRDPRPNDVVIDIAYCGVCHSDIHFVDNDLGGSRFPLVPGHEIAGVVAAVGSDVTRFKAGDRVGVGCLVNSCRHCVECVQGEEQYCENGSVGTYASTDVDGTMTQGGYSNHVTVDADFVLRIPDSIPLDKAAPLLCAGITMWSPLKTWGVIKGTKVGVVGLGGLGHMAVKLAAALGAEVTVISTSDGKKADALAMGATDFLVVKDAAAMRAARGRFNLILNSVSAPTEVNSQLALLARDGTMVMLGLVTEPLQVGALGLLTKRRSLAGSMIGGIRQTQEMLDFCAEHGISADIELIRPDQINEAYQRMAKSDVRYRFVIDMAAI
ncbi:MAG TPA: NAD(P)-dependent alcohol dehydrogenase [Caulobacteraceae bacterium]